MYMNIALRLCSRKFSILITGLAIFTLLPLFVEFLLELFFAASSKDSTKIIAVETDISLIFFGIGTFFVGRRVAMDWTVKTEKRRSQHHDLSLLECEIVGFYLILLGTCIELLHILIDHTNRIFQIEVFLEILTGFPIDLIGLFLIGRLFLHLVFEKETNKKLKNNP